MRRTCQILAILAIITVGLADLSQGVPVKNAKFYYDQGVDFFKKGQYDQARSKFFNKALIEFNKAIELNPRLGDAYNYRGLIYSKKKKYKQAIAEYNKAIQINSKNPAFYNNRGTAYYYSGDYDNAIVNYNKAIQINPNFAVAYKNRANAYFKKNDNSKGKQDMLRAQSLKSVESFRQISGGKK